MKKAIIHIGVEKTGTTTIQTCLRWNRDLLLDHGVGVLQSSGLQNDRKIATYCMKSKRVDDHVLQLGISEPNTRQEWKANFYNEFISETSALLEKVPTILISSEHLHSRLLRTKEVENLKDLLSPFFDSYTILVYLRRQDFLALSAISTARLSGGCPKGDFPPNIGGSHPYYNYKELLNKWSEVFGKQNINVRVFDKKCLYQEDLLQDFFKQTGLSALKAKLKFPEHQNISLSTVTQNVISVFNSYFPKNDQERIIEVNQLMRNWLIQTIESRFRGLQILPKRSDAENFYSFFKDSNNEVARIWFNRETLFADDFSMYPEMKSAVFLDEKLLTFIRATVLEVCIKYGAACDNKMLEDLEGVLSVYNQNKSYQTTNQDKITSKTQPKNKETHENVQLIVHIGQTKTGSSAIQQTLCDNKNHLLENFHILFPDFLEANLSKNGFINHTKFLRDAISNKNSTEILETLKKTKEFCIENQIKKIIISSSILFESSWGPAIFNEIRQKVFSDIKIIVYLRRQDHWLESTWNHWSLKSAKYTSISDFADKRNMNWYNPISRWLKFFGKSEIIVCPYEQNIIGENVVENFLKLIGIDKESLLESNIKISGRLNPSLKPAAVDILNIFNNRTNTILSAKTRMIFENVVKEKFRTSSPFVPCGLLSPKERYNIVKQYETSNNEIATLFFGSGSTELFNEPFPDPNESWCPTYPSIHESIQLFGELFMYQQEKFNSIDNKLQKLIISSNEMLSDHKDSMAFLNERINALNNLQLKDNNKQDNPPNLTHSGYNDKFAKIDSTSLQIDQVYESVKIKNHISAWELTEEGIMLSCDGDDPYFVLPKSLLKKACNEISIDITAPKSTELQVFYKTKFLQKFKEINSIRKPLKEGKNLVNIVLKQNCITGSIRIDLGNSPGKYVFHNILLS